MLWVFAAKRMFLMVKTLLCIYPVLLLLELLYISASFPPKMKEDNASDEEQFWETTVFEYFLKHRGVVLTYSKYLPCLDVGKPSKPIYLPIEICSLISLQRCRKLLSPTQQLILFEKTKLNPHDRMKALTDAVKNNQYEK